MRILIADDEVEFTELLKGRLCHEGNIIDTAYDGNRALELIKNNSYDIIFMDHNMPELTGLEVIRSAREIGTASKIVMVTAYEEMEDFLAKGVGADDYLTKPVKLEDIDRVVGALKRA
jgi:two-component system response regulator QseB